MTTDRLGEILALEHLSAPTVISQDIAWIAVPNDGVPSLWWRLRKALRTEGWCPIIAGSPTDAVRWLAQNLDEAKRPLSEPNEAAYKQFLKKRRRDMMEELDDPDMAANLKASRADVVIPETPNRGEFLALKDLGRDCPWSEVAIVFVRAEQAWMIPHILNWGGFNEAPHPTELALALWSWEQRHGAVAASFTSESIELFLQKPVSDLDGVITAAEEIAVICPDVVWQGTENATELASEIANRHIWFLWWD